MSVLEDLDDDSLGAVLLLLKNTRDSAQAFVNACKSSPKLRTLKNTTLRRSAEGFIAVIDHYTEGALKS